MLLWLLNLFRRDPAAEASKAKAAAEARAKAALGASTKRFNAFIEFIYEHECAYDKNGNVVAENVAGDTGGWTKWGIDLASHKALGVEGIKALTEPQARAIYWRDYWEKNRCGELPCPLGECHMDACVNNGPGNAANFLKATGGSAGSAAKYCDAREGFYRTRSAALRERFLKGWLARVADLRKRFGL